MTNCWYVAGHRTSLLFLVVAPLLVSLSCDSHTCAPEHSRATLSDIEARFLDADLDGNFFPGSPGWYLGATLSLENTHRDSDLAGIAATYADVYFVASGDYLGRVSLASDWDGYLQAGERDTVQLYFYSNENPFQEYTWLELRRLCSQYVWLDVGIHDSRDTVTARADSIWYSCAD
jgi:hypothetical protein